MDFSAHCPRQLGLNYSSPIITKKEGYPDGCSFWGARDRDSFAFLPLAKIKVSPPSSWRRPSCPRQLGLNYSSPIITKKKDTLMGILLFWCERWDSNPHGETTRTSNVLVYHSNTLANAIAL